MKVAKEIAKNILDGYLKHSPEFEMAERGDWISDGKYEYKSVVVKHIPTGKFYGLDDSRTGSYYSDYYKDSDEWNDEVELTEMKPVTKTITTYEAVK